MQALIVNSSNSPSTLLNDILQSNDMDVATASNFEEADALLQAQSFYMICIDTDDDTEHCFNLCKKLRADKRSGMLPIIVLAKNESQPLLKQAFSSGATEILWKSNYPELERSVKEYVHRFTQKRDMGHVLLVEDDEMVREYIKLLLTIRGMTIDVFSNAEEAWKSFVSNDYDLVITDIVLDGYMSGLSLLRRIRASEDDGRSLPVLVITSFSDNARKMEILASGADDYLPKPIHDMELITRVSNLIRSKLLCDQVKDQRETLRRLSTTDELTGLYNKNYLYEGADGVISNALRHNDPLSLLVVDLDRLKSINDNYGHETGDRILSALGMLLKASCRTGDIAARFGGDEFVIIMPHTDLAAANDKAEKLLKLIENLRPMDINITASIGATDLHSGDKKDFWDLFRIADIEVYKVKDRGGNSISVTT